VFPSATSSAAGCQHKGKYRATSCSRSTTKHLILSYNTIDIDAALKLLHFKALHKISC